MCVCATYACAEVSIEVSAVLSVVGQGEAALAVEPRIGPATTVRRAVPKLIVLLAIGRQLSVARVD